MVFIKYNDYELLEISTKTIFLFVVCCLITTTIKLPVPGMGREFAINVAEFIITLECLMYMGLHKYGLKAKENFDGATLNKVKISALLLCIYIIISRIMMVVTGFNLDCLSYPRVSVFFMLSFFWLIIKDFSSKEKIDAILLFVTWVNVLEMIYLFNNGEVRTSAILVNINIYVCLFVIVLPILLRMLFVTEKKLRMIWYAMIIISGFALVVLSGSRAGTGIASAFCIYEIYKNSKSRIAVFSIGIICLLVIILIANLNDFENQDNVLRALSIFTGLHGLDASDSMRSELWNIGLEKIKSNIMFGTGELSFDYYWMGEYLRQGAHNFLIELLMSYGVVGTLIYCVMLCNMVKVNVSNKLHASIVNATIIGYLMFSFVEPTFVEKILLFVFLLVITSDLEWMKCDGERYSNTERS